MFLHMRFALCVGFEIMVDGFHFRMPQAFVAFRKQQDVPAQFTGVDRVDQGFGGLIEVDVFGIAAARRDDHFRLEGDLT